MARFKSTMRMNSTLKRVRLKVTVAVVLFVIKILSFKKIKG